MQELFFSGKSEVEVANEMGIARTTMRSRKDKIITRIRKITKF